jgi:Fe-S cluster biogenesis protein NfuA
MGSRRQDASGLHERVRLALRHAPAFEGLLGPDDVEFVGIDDGDIVQVRLSEACAGCSASLAPLIEVIERAVQAEVPEVRLVEVVP